MKTKLKAAIALFLFAILLFPSAELLAQRHFRYSNYMDNMGPINPTWYLADPSNSIHSLVRKQWVGIEGAPTTLIFNGHVPLQTIGSATGLNLSYDSFGPEKLFNVSSFFAKKIQLNEQGHFLSASLSLGINRYEALYSSLDGQDPTFRDDVMETQGIMGLGVMYYKPERFYIGFSIPQLSMRKLGKASQQDEYELSIPYYGMIGYIAKLNDVFKIKPVVMGTWVQGLPAAYDFSATLYIQDALGLGLSYGSSREMGTSLSFHANNHLRLGYHYLFGTESYGKSNKGNNTHEIGLAYRFGKGTLKRLL